MVAKNPAKPGGVALGGVGAGTLRSPWTPCSQFCCGPETHTNPWENMNLQASLVHGGSHLQKIWLARQTASFWGELKIPRTSQHKSHNHKWQSRTFSWNLNLYRNTNLQTAAGLKPSEPEPSIKSKPVSSTSSAGAEPTQLSTCSKSPVLSPKKTYNWSDAEFAKQNAIIASTWLSKQIKIWKRNGIPTISPRGVKHKLDRVHAVPLPRAAIEATRIFPRFTSGLLRSSMNSAAGAEQQCQQLNPLPRSNNNIARAIVQSIRFDMATLRSQLVWIS